MTDLLSDVDAPSDAELISRVRGGDVAAYGQLFTRHRDAANRLARQLVRGPDSDDLVAEAFAKVLTVLQGGGGPDVAFRAYLLTAVRRLHVDRVRAGQRVQTTDDLTPFDPGIPFQDTAVAGFESGAAAKAFASLPERWQLVLWHLEVEGQKPADIAPLLGMSANSVSALAYRAREGLRQAFLTMHLSDLTETDCRWVTEHLGAFVRKGLSKRDSGKVQDHLDECRRCTAMYLELTEVNDNLAGIIAPLLLGAAATGYLASGAGSAGLFALVSSRIKDFVGANTGAVSAAGVTVGVAAAAIAVFTLGGGGGARPEAKAPEAPVGVTSAASPSVGAPSPRAPSAGPPAAAPTIAPTTTLSPAGVALFSPSAGFPTATASEPATIESPSPSASPSDSPSASPSESPAETPSGSTESPSTEPTTEPTTPGPTDVDVSLAGTTVDDDGVHLVTNGSPLPPTVTVVLSSASEGVGFARNGDCPVAPNGREATCDLSPAGAGARTPATAVRFTGTSYSADLPFNSLADEPDVDIDVEFRVPAGFRVADLDSVATRFHHVLLHDVDVALTIPGTARPEAPGNVYTVPATVTVGGTAKNRVSDITYTVTGGKFVAGDGTRTGSTTLPKDAALSFRVEPDNPIKPTVTIAATVPAPLVDKTEQVDLDLSPFDVSLAADLTPVTPHADEYGNQQFTAMLGRDGFDGDLEYTLVGDDAVLRQTTERDGEVTFTVHGDTDGPIAIRVDLPAGFTDKKPDNNTAEADVTLAREVDVALSVADTVRPEAPGNVYTVPATVAVTGPARDRVSDITYTVTGGKFVTGDGTRTGSTTLPKDAALSFRVEPDDPVKPTVTIAATVPAPLVDKTEQVAVDLSPFDVSLAADLTPVTPHADEYGNQQFTAMLDRDGFDGDLEYTLVGDDAVLRQTTERDGEVTFTVHGDHDGPIAIRVDLPAGFTDKNPDNNTTSARWTPQPPPTTDLRLTPLTPARPVPDKDENLYRLGTTLHVFGDVPPSATLSIAEGAGVRFVSVDGCVVDSTGTQATCQKPVNGSRLALVLSAATDRSTDLTISVSAPAPFIETRPENNSRSTRLLPAPQPARYVDVAVSVLATPLRPGADDRYAVPLTVRLSGPAAGQASRITYTVSGGFFVAADGSSRRTTTRPADEATPTFSVRPTNRTAPVVTISGGVPPPLQDKDASNDTTDALPLTPYDVSLGDLSATTEHADGHGDQEFTAKLNSDGLDGVRFELVEGPTDAVLRPTTATGDGWVRFTVRSKTDSPHPVAIRAVLPTGFTDADTRNNTTQIATFTPARTADLRLAASFLWYEKHDKDDEGDKLGEIEATVWNAPATTLTFTIPDHRPVELTESPDCSLSEDHKSATCRVSTPGTFHTTFGIKLPPGQLDKVQLTVTAAGYDDPNRDDNTVLVGLPEND